MEENDSYFPERNGLRSRAITAHGIYFGWNEDAWILYADGTCEFHGEDRERFESLGEARLQVLEEHRADKRVRR